MIERGFGRIVNTTSGIALEAEQAGYSAAKAALNKVTIDLGGPNAPNKPESAIPGILVGAFVSDEKSGRLFGAQDFSNLSLSDAVIKAESQDSPYKR